MIIIIIIFKFPPPEACRASPYIRLFAFPSRAHFSLGHWWMPIQHLLHTNLPVMPERFPPYVYSLCPFSAWPFALARAVCIASVHVQSQEDITVRCSDGFQQGVYPEEKSAPAKWDMAELLSLWCHSYLMKYAHTKIPWDDKEYYWNEY